MLKGFGEEATPGGEFQGIRVGVEQQYIGCINPQLLCDMFEQ